MRKSYIIIQCMLLLLFWFNVAAALFRSHDMYFVTCVFSQLMSAKRSGSPWWTTTASGSKQWQTWPGVVLQLRCLARPGSGPRSCLSWGLIWPKDRPQATWGQVLLPPRVICTLIFMYMHWNSSSVTDTCYAYFEIPCTHMIWMDMLCVNLDTILCL